MALFFDFSTASSSCSFMCCAMASGVSKKLPVLELMRRRGVVRRLCMPRFESLLGVRRRAFLLW